MGTQQNEQMDVEERLTKRQRRELRRQEKAQARARHNGGRSAWTIVIIVVLVFGAGIWWMIAKGGTTSASGLDAMKKDASDPFLGSVNASVVVREFGDFQCPACKAAQPVVKEIVQKYGDSIKLEFNDFPLLTLHKNSLAAAEAAHCAEDQQKFWAYHDKLYDKQEGWSEVGTKEAAAAFKQYGADLGFDASTFDACVDADGKRSIVQDDINQGNAAKVTATPTFFVNDQKFTGVPSAEQLSSLIDDELKKAPAAGTNALTNSARP